MFSFIRRGEPGTPEVVVVANFSAVPHEGYRLGLPSAGVWDEVVNTDAETYTGSGVGNLGSITASTATTSASRRTPTSSCRPWPRCGSDSAREFLQAGPVAVMSRG